MGLAQDEPIVPVCAPDKEWAPALLGSMPTEAHCLLGDTSYHDYELRRIPGPAQALPEDRMMIYC